MAKHRKKDQAEKPTPDAGKHEKPHAHHAKAARTRRKLPNWPVLVLALAGAGLSGFLAASSRFGQSLPYCSAGSACELVQTSRWAYLFGIPVAAWGMLAFLTMAFVAGQVRQVEWHWKSLWTLSLLSLAISVYLTVIALVALEAACPYCLVSLGITAAVFGVVAWQYPPGLPDFAWPAWLAQTGGLALVVVAAFHFYHAGWLGADAGPEDPYLKALAIHLNQSDAQFFGAEWCPRCQDQKEMFGRSAFRLPFVDCSPGGRNAPPAPICSVNGVESYPTWIIRGERHLGILPLAELARLSGFQPPGEVRR